MFALAALVLFILAALSVALGDLNVVALGLACVAAHLLVGLWPLGVGTFRINRAPRN